MKPIEVIVTEKHLKGSNYAPDMSNPEWERCPLDKALIEMGHHYLVGCRNLHGIVRNHLVPLYNIPKDWNEEIVEVLIKKANMEEKVTVKLILTPVNNWL